jgi:SAM-dependent methyltransferase
VTSPTSDGANDWNFIWQNLSEGMSRNPGREYRFSQVLDLFPAEKNLHVLDFGCGTGNLLKLLATQFPQNEYWGADTSDAGIEASKLLVPQANIHKINLSKGKPFLETPFRSFDIIVCSEVIEHIEEDLQTLQFLFSLLKKGGGLILTVPSGPISKFDVFIGHCRHYSKNSLECLLEEAGFINIKVNRSGFPAINILRIGTIVAGNAMIPLLQKSSFAESGSSRYVTLFLQKLFRISLKDSYFGWQLISRCQKPEEG